MEAENKEGDAMGWWMKRSWHEAYHMAGGAITHVGIGGAVVERALYGLGREGKRGLRTDEMRSTGKGARRVDRSGGLCYSL